MWPFMAARNGALTNSGHGSRQGAGRGCHGTGVLVALLGMVVMAGCANTVVNPQYQSAQWNLMKPTQIFVYDFAVTREQVHENAGFLQGTINLETAVETHIQAQGTEPKDLSTAPQFTKTVNSSMASNG